jgi:hypothetical protein
MAYYKYIQIPVISNHIFMKMKLTKHGKKWQRFWACALPPVRKKCITIRRRVCEAVPPCFTWPGRYLSSGRASPEGRLSVRTGGIREHPVIFSGTFKKRELPGLHFACGVFIMGIKADVKDFLTVSLSQWRGLRSASAAVPACLAMPEAVTVSQAVRPSTALV